MHMPQLNIVIVGWLVVSVGWMALSIAILKTKRIGHRLSDHSTTGMGVAFIVGSLVAACYVTMLMTGRTPL